MLKEIVHTADIHVKKKGHLLGGLGVFPGAFHVVSDEKHVPRRQLVGLPLEKERCPAPNQKMQRIDGVLKILIHQCAAEEARTDGGAVVIL